VPVRVQPFERGTAAGGGGVGHPQHTSAMPPSPYARTHARNPAGTSCSSCCAWAGTTSSCSTSSGRSSSRAMAPPACTGARCATAWKVRLVRDACCAVCGVAHRGGDAAAARAVQPQQCPHTPRDALPCRLLHTCRGVRRV
jgi:hypothetical protein